MLTGVVRFFKVCDVLPKAQVYLYLFDSVVLHLDSMERWIESSGDFQRHPASQSRFKISGASTYLLTDLVLFYTLVFIQSIFQPYAAWYAFFCAFVVSEWFALLYLGSSA